MSQQGRNHAILIGSSQFALKSGLTDLRCPQNDVDGMAELLTSAEFGLFAKDDLSVFKNQPHYEILPEIETVFAKASSEDLILFYYSGHGFCDASDRLYLATADSRKELLTSTWLPTERLRRMIDHHNRRRVVMILDCCYSAAIKHDFLSRGDDEGQLDDLSTGIFIITASSAVETAIEKEGDEYGLLTKHILEGVRHGKARSSDDGMISAGAIYNCASAEVVKAGEQKPRFFGLEQRGGELFIARAAAAYSAQRLQEFRKLIGDLERKGDLDDDLCDYVRGIIRENQIKRDKQLFDLLSQLHKEQLTPGKFTSQWYKLAPPIQVASASLPPQPLSPTGKTTNPPAPKPPKQTEIVAITSEHAKPPVIAEPPPSPPTVEPSSESVQSPVFSRKPSAPGKPPEGGTWNTFAPRILLFWAWLLTSRRARMWLVASAIGLPVIVLSSYLILMPPFWLKNPPVNPTPTPTPTPVSILPDRVEVLRYEQLVEPGGIRFSFNARQSGYLYILSRDDKDKKVQFWLLTSWPNAESNRLEAGKSFVFPATVAPLKLSAGSVPFTLIFSSQQITKPNISRYMYVDLTPQEKNRLEELEKISTSKHDPKSESLLNGGIVTALTTDDSPLVAKITVRQN